MGPPNRSMGLKPSLLCAPFGELPLHHEAEGVAFFLFPISNFSSVCERGAVKTTPLALLCFLLARESWCPRRPPGSVPNAPALRPD